MNWYYITAILLLIGITMFSLNLWRRKKSVVESETSTEPEAVDLLGPMAINEVEPSPRTPQEEAPTKKESRWGKFFWFSFEVIGFSTLFAIIIMLAIWFSKDTVTFLGLLGFPFVVAAFAVLTIWSCAKSQFLWTFVQRNQLILLDRGKGNPYKVLGLKSSRNYRWYRLQRYGIHWMGLPPVEVHEFPLVHERVNTKINPDTEHKEWLERDTEPKTARYLLKTVVHWAYVPGLELKGGRRVDILFQYQATVVGKKGARTAVYDREGKFYDILNSVIESNVLSLEKMRSISYDDFIIMEKDENSPLMVGDLDKPNSGLLHEINKTAAERSGYKIDSIFVFRFDASSKSEEELSRLKEEARIKADAKIIEAEGNVADISQTIKAIKDQLKEADHTTVAEIAGRLAVADRVAKSNLQAVGGAMLGLSPDNNQSGGRKRRKK